MSDIEIADIEDVEECTAFYRQNGIINGSRTNPGFPFKKIYDDIFAAFKPHMEAGHDARSVATVLICAALDNITMTMAAAKQEEEYDQEKDMGLFMEMLMSMISHVENGINTNGQLAATDKSIYNIEPEKTQLDS